ncbi:protein TBATA-like [Gigantopelta aegis]|uniref:protein TBATA-like n=1 Tax=Gigantopelta aegis TaxID=1735272 RepID=UPI001B88E71C|nr:protein TBATA-like [Gigantopelta aegis]
MYGESQTIGYERKSARMSQSEVFRPSNGDLIVRDPVSNGHSVNMDYLQRRPSTQGGYRFGQLSHNSFFTRHNPHPVRVRHMKGLLDIPICTVNDDGYFANPRYSLNFPPDSYSERRLSAFNKTPRMPINAINVNSQLHPINTITGLQYFTGLNSYPFREKAIPKVGLVPVTESWRDELKAFTQQLQEEDADRRREEKPEERPRTTQYSTATGRLIPPPSRAMSRAGSRRGARPMNMFQHIAAEPDVENSVFAMLCQILQTDDVNAVQAWLCSASPSEKAMVQDLIKAAMSGREEYWKQYPAEYVDDKMTKLPPISEKMPPTLGRNDDTDSTGNRIQERLILDELINRPADGLDPAIPVPPPTQPQIPMKPNTPKPMIEDNEFNIEPPSNTVFKTDIKRPPTQSSKVLAPQRSDHSPPGTADVRLKYTKSPLRDTNLQDAVWQQSDSINMNTF